MEVRGHELIIVCLLLNIATALDTDTLRTTTSQTEPNSAEYTEHKSHNRQYNGVIYKEKTSRRDLQSVDDQVDLSSNDSLESLVNDERNEPSPQAKKLSRYIGNQTLLEDDSAVDPTSELFTLPQRSSDLLPVLEPVVSDPSNRFLTAPSSYNMEGSEIIEPSFIVPENVAFAPPVPPPFVQPRKTYGLTINDGTVKRNEVRKDNGEFISSYTSADGTTRTESARLVRTSTGEEVLVYKGSYSYSTPDGQMFRVEYTADRNGFRTTSTPVTGQAAENRPLASQNPYLQQPQRPVKIPQRPYQRPQKPVKIPPKNPYQQPSQIPQYQKPPQRPIHTTYQRPPTRPNPNPQNPYQQPVQGQQINYQRPPKRPVPTTTQNQQRPQGPVQTSSQNPYQQPHQQQPQRPVQTTGQTPYQQPYQQQTQRPVQTTGQTPYQQPYQQQTQRPVQTTSQTPYQQLYQQPPTKPVTTTQSSYQQTSQSSQNSYQRPPQIQNPTQAGQQTFSIPVQHLPSSIANRPKNPHKFPAFKPPRLPIVSLSRPNVQNNRERLPLIHPNHQSNKPHVYIKLPLKPIPHSTTLETVHPIPPIPNHRPITL